MNTKFLMERLASPVEAPPAPTPTKPGPAPKTPARPDTPKKPDKHPNPFRRPRNPGERPGILPGPKARNRERLSAEALASYYLD
jgi:hypothetical protein